MPNWMGIERGNDRGDASVARHCDSPADHRLMAEVKPVEVAKRDHGAAKLRWQCPSAFDPNDRLVGPALRLDALTIADGMLVPARGSRAG